MLRHFTSELAASRLQEDKLWVKPLVVVLTLDLPGGSEVKNLPAMQKTRIRVLG